MSKYESLGAAIEAVEDARAFQRKSWPNVDLVDAGGRPFEEWVVLLHHYMNKLDAVYAETPGNDRETNQPNIEGRKRIKKYMAIIANLALWGVQSAMDGAGEHD